VLLATLVASAAINYTILHTPFVFIVILVLLAHEFGHYFTSLANGALPSVPYIIPLPFIAIGITRIKNFKKLPNDVIKSIVLGGPFTGFITAMFIFMYLLVNPVVLPTYAFLLMVSEVFLNFFGSDGRTYRSIKQRELSCIL
jgi:hypothetical protein